MTPLLDQSPEARGIDINLGTYIIKGSKFLDLKQLLMPLSLNWTNNDFIFSDHFRVGSQVDFFNKDIGTEVGKYIHRYLPTLYEYICICLNNYNYSRLNYPAL